MRIPALRPERRGHTREGAGCLRQRGPARPSHYVSSGEKDWLPSAEHVTACLRVNRKRAQKVKDRPSW